MNGIVPPRIHTKKTVIGVGNREIVILGVTAFIALGVILTSMNLVVKVGFAALILGSGTLLALGRAPRSGKSFEKYFLEMWDFYRRPRFYQRGAGYERPEREVREFTRVEAKEVERSFKKQRRRELVTIKPLPLSMGGFFSVLSISFLIMLILWIWTGGLQEYLLRFGVTF